MRPSRCGTAANPAGSALPRGRRSAPLAANNYANSLGDLQRFEEAKTLLRKMLPVARRVVGESHDVKFRMQSTYATALYRDPGATLDEIREAVTLLEDMARIARRVLGNAHPLTARIEDELQNARAALARASLAK